MYYLVRRHLTLIELIVVMIIISLAAGVIGINVNKAFQEQRFRTEVNLVLDQLRLAQNLMLILNEDVKVHFKNVEGGVKLWLSFQCPITTGWGREISREPPLLKAVRHINFKGINADRNPEEFALNFLSEGMVMSRGILLLSTGQGRQYVDKRYVCLHGYPSPLTSTIQKPDPRCINDDEFKHNDQLTQFIMPEIISKIHAQNAPENEVPK